MTYVPNYFARDAFVFFIGLIFSMSFGVLAQSQTAHPDGFWKCRAASSVKGEFAGEDPVGLAGHAHIPTDCVLNLSTGGKTYCFSSRPSLEEFQIDPAQLLEQRQRYTRSDVAER
jgi:YHS domain-containing protein